MDFAYPIECVGGPLDGKWVTDLGYEYRYPALSYASPLFVMSEIEAVAAHRMLIHRYVRATMRYHGLRVAKYRYEGVE